MLNAPDKRQARFSKTCSMPFSKTIAVATGQSLCPLGHAYICLPEQCKLERSPSTDQSVSLSGVALITWHCILVKLTGIMAELDSRSLAHDTCILHDPVRIVCFRGKGWSCSIVFGLGCCSLMYTHSNHGTWPNLLMLK